MQRRDQGTDELAHAEVKTRRAPTTQELADLRFAWVVAKHVKSNAIVLGKGGMIVGVGAGQMSRVDSVHIACRKAGDRVKGSVMASDAFFPFRDNIDEAAKAGVVAIAANVTAKRKSRCLCMPNSLSWFVWDSYVRPAL